MHKTNWLLDFLTRNYCQNVPHRQVSILTEYTLFLYFKVYWLPFSFQTVLPVPVVSTVSRNKSLLDSHVLLLPNRSPVYLSSSRSSTYSLMFLESKAIEKPVLPISVKADVDNIRAK